MEAVSQAFNEGVDGAHGFDRRIVHVDRIAQTSDGSDGAFIKPAAVNSSMTFCVSSRASESSPRSTSTSAMFRAQRPASSIMPAAVKCAARVAQTRKPACNLTARDQNKASAALCARDLSCVAEIRELSDGF